MIPPRPSRPAVAAGGFLIAAGLTSIKQRAESRPPASGLERRGERTVTFSSVRDIGPPSPDDPPELTEAAELHIMLLPADHSAD
jgi:hypothetical protein